MSMCGTDGTSILKPRLVMSENSNVETEMIKEVIDTRKEHYWQDSVLTNDKDLACSALLSSDLPERSDNSMDKAVCESFEESKGLFLKFFLL